MGRNQVAHRGSLAMPTLASSTPPRFLRTYGRALGFLRPYRGAAVALCAANAGLAAIGFAEPVLFGHIIQDLGAGGPTPGSIAAWAGLGLGAILAAMATSLVADRLSHRVRLAVVARTYAHVLALPSAFHARHPTGHVTKTLWTGTDELFNLWLSLFREHLSTALILLALLPVALVMNPALGTVLVLLAVVFAVTVALTSRRTEAGQRRAEDAGTALATQVGDVLGNAALIRTLDAAPAEVASVGRLAADVLRHQLPVLAWWAGVTVMSRAASTLATVAVVCLGAWLHARGQATVAEVVTFMGFAGMLIGRLEGAMWAVARLGGTIVKLQDLFTLLDTASTVADPAGQPALPPGPGTVEFRDVRFGYPGGAPVLGGVSFTARPGETVALVGETGSGKTTAMALLQRGWDTDGGQVLVDGQDIRDVSLASLRDRIGTVPQETLLLNRSIRDNLLLARPGATEAEMEHAARLAEAHGFITRQPHGYDTVVGERGVALSGGQRQRLAIARALLRDPRILVLDEATSALDGGTEEKVVRAMRAASVGRTTFVIAHRLSTIRDADRILFFAGGTVTEEGTFDELVARDGAFAALARTQFLAPILAPILAPVPLEPAPHLRLVYSREEEPADCAEAMAM